MVADNSANSSFCFYSWSMMAIGQDVSVLAHNWCRLEKSEMSLLLLLVFGAASLHQLWTAPLLYESYMCSSSVFAYNCAKGEFISSAEKTRLPSLCEICASNHCTVSDRVVAQVSRRSITCSSLEQPYRSFTRSCLCSQFKEACGKIWNVVRRIVHWAMLMFCFVGYKKKNTAANFIPTVGTNV